jgi:dihydropteroate synthase
MVSWGVLARGRAVIGGVTLGGEAPVAVIGALNVSPESFYPGSVRLDGEALVEAGLAMVEEGAVMLDVGARSTAPYRAAEIDEDEERRRLGAAVEQLVAKVEVPVAADTTRPEPARAAVEAGARVLNDVGGLRDPRLAALAADHDLGLILMASPPAAGGDRAPTGSGPVDTVRDELAAALGRARSAGIADERVVLDPGIGFFRDVPMGWVAWDLAVLGGLGELGRLGRPLCVGLSRKSFLGALTGRTDPADRLAASLAATAVAVVNGAVAVRTHDVRETVDAVRVAERLRRTAR